MSDHPYDNFDKFLFRNPVIPTNHKIDLAQFILDPLFREAIYLASPDLFQATSEAQGDPAKFQEIKVSLLKYYLRMKFRCTPFGIFAGCGIGTMGEKSEIELSDFEPRTRLDMNLLDNILLNISSSADVAKELIFFPNSSLYRIGDKYRYIEYRYKNNSRKYFLSSIEVDDYINGVLTYSKTGAKIDELVDFLVAMDNDIETEDAQLYINELIDNQILSNNLAPSLTGENANGRTIKNLSSFRQEKTHPQVKLLDEIESLLKELDEAPLGRPIEQYRAIESLVESIGINYNKKYLFQTDLHSKTKISTLSHAIVKEAKSTLCALNKLSIRQENQLLKKFKENFHKRYEYEEIPLTEVLDSDLGIGFGNNVPGTGDNNPLLDGFPFGNMSGSGQDVSLSPLDQLMLKKIDEITGAGGQEIRITDNDLKHLKEEWNDLPLTMSSMVEVLDPQGLADHSLCMRYASGSSAANLMSRFGYLSDDIGSFIEQIFEKEDRLIPEGSIIAEIVHLPEARTGNILARTQTRHYEIPFLAQTSVTEPFVVPVTDLMVSVVGDQIRLRSRKLNVNVIPRLTSAHNFSNNSLPMYHFLSSMQTAGLRPAIGFNWGQYLMNKPFLPRVVYGKTIISPKIWNISAEELKPQGKGKPDYEVLRMVQKDKKIPSQVLLLQGDNKLMIDFNSEDSLDVLLKESKGQSFKIEEYLFTEKTPLIKKGNSEFSNQIILAFYKK